VRGIEDDALGDDGDADTLDSDISATADRAAKRLKQGFKG
jgi:hypothetical protein